MILIAPPSSHESHPAKICYLDFDYIMLKKVKMRLAGYGIHILSGADPSPKHNDTTVASDYSKLYCQTPSIEPR